MQQGQASEYPLHDADDSGVILPGAQNSVSSLINEGSRIVSVESRRRDYRRQSSLTPHADLTEAENEEVYIRNNSDDVEGRVENQNDVNMSGDGESDVDEGFNIDYDGAHYEYIHLDDSESDDASIDHPSNSDGDLENEIVPDNNIGPLQPAKNHSYLPTAQPLYPEKWLGTHRQRLSDRIGDENDDAGTHESAECEVTANGFATNNDDDAFSLQFNIPEPPGGLNRHTSITCTKLCHEEIPDSAERTTLAVLEMDDAIVLFPGAVLPLRLRDQKWVSYLGAMIDDARGLYGAHQKTMEGMGEVRLVILPRCPTGTRRTRRTPVEGHGRTGRWQVNLIRLGATSLRRHARRRRAPESIETRSADRPNRIEDVESGSTHDDQGSRQRQNQAQEQPTSPSSEGDSDEDELFHPTHKASTPGDPLVGRIGTLATVVFTHEETITSSITGVGSPQRHNSPPSVWRNRTGELVLTFLGTQRCRLVSSVKDKIQDRIPLYVIEEVHDVSAALPPSWMLQLPGNARCPIATPVSGSPLVDSDAMVELSETDSGSRGGIYSAAILNVSHRTCIPAIAYSALWPWRLCQKICDLIHITDDFQGLRDILPSANGLCCDLNGSNQSCRRAAIQVVDPSAFANWVAANMPLSVNGRLDLLEMTSTVQQLKFILKKMEAKRKESILRCMNCGTAISQMRHVFSVGGSDGTTGAYVNEYGVVHQTMTLREVDGNVVCTGRPETRDSWFPGYSWQVAHCSICSAHLGWKFRMISKGNDDDPDRPLMFWGFSSLTTDEHVKPRRVMFPPGRNIVALLQLS